MDLFVSDRMLNALHVVSAVNNPILEMSGVRLRADSKTIQFSGWMMSQKRIIIFEFFWFAFFSLPG